MKPILPSDPELDILSPLELVCASAQETLLTSIAPATLPPEIAQHVQSCPQCRDFQALLPVLLDGLAGLPVPRGDELINRVLAESLAERRSTLRRRRLTIGAGLAVAASILVVIFGAIQSREQGRRVTSLPDPDPRPPVEQSSPPATQTPALRETILEARDSVVSALSRTADETVETTRSWLPGPMAIPAPNLLQPLEPAVSSLEEVGQGAAVSVQPFADSARRAVGLFWKDLPTID